MWVCILFDFDVDTHAVAVRLVTQVGDAVETLLLDEIGDLFNE